MQDGTDDLKSFGLSGYEAAAYAAVLQTGPCEASAVAQRADVPTGRIYDVLNGLVEKRLLVVDSMRPKRYRAAPPAAALASLLHSQRREFEERYESLTKLASDLERRLAPRKRDAPTGAFYHVAVGETAARVHLAEKAREAKREILLTLQFERPLPVDEEVFGAYVEAADRGVSIRALVPDADIPKLLDSEYNELIARTILPKLGAGIDVRVLEGEATPFAVIDREKALIAVKNPLDPHAYFASVYLWDPAFAKDLAERFETLWREGAMDVGQMLGPG